MSYIFFNSTAKDVATRQASASGIDQEAIHQIRLQARIERAKVVRQCFASLKRLATADHTGRSIS